MNKKDKIPDKYQIWIDVRKQYHLSHVHIQMARELGMNPKKFGKIANEKQEPWKKTLPLFIEGIYLKRFGRDRPADVKSIEEVFRAKEKKKEERRKKKELQKEADPSNRKTNPFLKDFSVCGIKKTKANSGVEDPVPSDFGQTLLK